ncbi:MAG: TlyA family RNA methyltransferase [Clostridiales bacterium]|nr:TlyA family RNA methyltransferase [Clostridiales bacterium]
MRLDEYLTAQKFFDSRTKAKQAIERGEINVNGKTVLKPSYDLIESEDNNIQWIRAEDYVSLGGYKLSKALKDFNFSVKDLVVADIGASTGGFTDCLLKNGAKKVFAVDLNDGLLHEKLKNDNRVFPIIKNAKDLIKDDFNSELDLLVADLSFISATMVIPVFSELIDSKKHVILLIKPQFEVGEKKKFKNGIIRDEGIRDKVCQKVIDCAKDNNFDKIALTTAPINEGKNVEYLLLLKRR